MGSKVSTFGHGRILNLYRDKAKAKGDDPSSVIDRFEVLTVCLSISNNTSLSLGGDTESDKVKDEICNTHVNGVPIKDELRVVRPGRRSFD